MRICRRIRLWKLILLLVFVVIALQIFHMSLLSKLESQETREFKEINQLLLDIGGKISRPQRLDASGTYHVIPNIVVASSRHFKNSDNITIVTQCSSNHLHHLVELTERWAGPVSVSLFTYDADIEFTMQSIAYYHGCNKRIQRSVTFHVVFPINSAQIKHNPLNFDCGSPPVRSEDGNYAINGIEYPNNLLRNQAIIQSRTTHILVIDIDMLPSDNLGKVFKSIRQKYSFLRQSTFISHTAYVIPAFELKEGHKIPADKKELVKMWEANLIRPFYKEACWKCQKYTDYEKWKSLKPGESTTYTVEWKDPWEPFYIGAKTIPLYDERFKQFGFNRISQVCELHIAGFQFTVLSDVFLVHKGFKKPELFHKTKDQEQQRNRLLFRTFKHEILSKYEETERRC